MLCYTRLRRNKANSYDEWAANPMVAAIKSALTKLGVCHQQLREQLLSLLSDNPKSWLKKHFGVGRVVVNKAIDHATAYGPGLRPTVATKLSRDRRKCRKVEFLLAWTRRNENSESSPEIRRDHSGRLVQQATTYRVNNRYQRGVPILQQSSFLFTQQGDGTCRFEE
jgi:hypothetical protein